MFLIIIAPYFGSAICFFWPRCSQTLASGYSASVACAQNTGAEVGSIQTGPEPGYSLWSCASPPYLWQFRQFKSDIWWVLWNRTKVQRSPRTPLWHSSRGAYVSHVQPLISSSTVSSVSFHPPKIESDLLFLQQQSCVALFHWGVFLLLSCWSPPRFQFPSL